jgi:23S rRNA pseudouridine1911/1915/1917 synthase
MSQHIHIVPKDAVLVRLSDYGPGIFHGLSTKSAFKKAIKKGEIQINGKPGTTGHLVKPDEEITWQEPDQIPENLFHIDLDIIFEDDHLAIVNKPAGIVVNGNQFRTLENALPLHLKPSTQPDRLMMPRAIHRLDAPTSGLIIIAKTADARVQLSRQMEKKEIRKTYHSVVIGETRETWSSEVPVDEKPATTLYEKLTAVPSLRSGTLTLVKAMPLTGRTHQIRKHLAEANTPILGDKIYGKEGLIMRRKGLFLCATGVEIRHPKTGEPLSIEIKPPEKFGKFMRGEERRWKKYKV